MANTIKFNGDLGKHFHSLVYCKRSTSDFQGIGNLSCSCPCIRNRKYLLLELGIVQVWDDQLRKYLYQLITFYFSKINSGKVLLIIII